MRHLLLLLTFAGCLGPPKSAADQAKAFNEKLGGQVDGSLTPIGDRGGYAQSPQGRGIELQDTSSGQFCVQSEDSARIWFKETAESLTEKAKRYGGTVVFAFGAYDSLDQFQNGPDKSSAIPGTLVKARAKEDFAEAGPGTGSMWLHYVLEWCAPLPAIASTTRYLTATRWAPEREYPAVYIWKINGTPTARTGPSTPSAPSTTATATAQKPAEAAKKPAETAGGTALEFLRSEGYTRMVELAVAAGKEQDLASGNLIIFAAPDSALPGSKFDPLVADKKRAVALFDDLVSDGALTKQQLMDKGSVTLTMRSGRKAVLGYEKSRPTLDGKKLQHEVVEGSSWIIFRTLHITFP